MPTISSKTKISFYIQTYKFLTTILIQLYQKSLDIVNSLNVAIANNQATISKLYDFQLKSKISNLP